jgi:hypothetical protein
MFPTVCRHDLLLGANRFGQPALALFKRFRTDVALLEMILSWKWVSAIRPGGDY